MLKPKQRLAALASVAMLHLTLSLPLAGQDVRSSWECLPDETIAAFRVPNGDAFFTALRTQTQIGTVLFQEQRLQAVLDFFKENNPDGWGELHEALGRQGLELSDYGQLVGNDFGYAMVVEPRADREPLQIGLAWFSPGEELAAKFYNALGDMIEHQEESDNPTTRVDIRLADCDVMHLTVPELGMDWEAIYGPEPDWDNMDEQQLQAWFEAQEKRREEAKPMVVDYKHMMIARVGGRLLVAHTNPQSQQQVLELKRENRPIDIAELTGVEPLTGTFARFIDAHSNGGTEFAARIMATRGLNAALPAGEPGAEVVVDVPRILTMMREEEPESLAVFEQIGLANMGPIVGRLTLEGGALRLTAVASIPTPRTGFPELLEASQRSAEPPAWVSVDVLEYSHLSLPLDKVFAKIREIVLASQPEAAMIFQMIEMQVNETTQSDIMTLLAGLGDQLGYLRFVPKAVDAEAFEKIDEWDVMEPEDRYAVVWQLQNEEVWRKAVDTMMTAAGAPPATEEQGFTSYRAPEGAGAGGVFIGRGYMVVANGENVAEETLAMLRNPPTGNGALRNSERYQRSAQLIPQRSAIAYVVTDMRRHMSAMGAVLKAGIFDEIIYGGMFDGPDGELVNGLTPGELGAAMEKLLPSAEESENFFGVSVSQLYFSDAGLIFESVIEVPPPQ